MSTETATCPQCGAQIPANERFCRLCGHANPGFVEDPQTSTGNGGDNAGLAKASLESTESTAPDTTPQMGTPTVNVGAADVSASNAPAWQPGQYNAAPISTPPPAQGQQYSPPPAYPQTQNFQPGGAQPPAYTNYQYQPVATGIQPRDPTVALLLELIGYVGFLGIGHIYAGRTARGIGLLLGWWAYWIIVAVLFVTVILSPVACVMAILWPVVPILSGLWIRSELIKEQSAIRPY